MYGCNNNVPTHDFGRSNEYEDDNELLLGVKVTTTTTT